MKLSEKFVGVSKKCHTLRRGSLSLYQSGGGIRYIADDNSTVLH